MWSQGIILLSVVAVGLAAHFHSKKNSFQQQDVQQYTSSGSFQQAQPLLQQQQQQPSPYSFGYEAEASARQESQDANGKVTGSYKVMNEDGSMRTVQYVADEQGFRASVDTNEPGTHSDSPADVQLRSAFVPTAPQKSAWESRRTTSHLQQKPVEYDLGSQGQYSYAYESRLEDGGSSAHSESSDGSGQVVGRYSLSAGDGRRRQVAYTSGQQGFHATVESNEQGTKSESPADVLFYSSAAAAEPQAAPAHYSKASLQQQQQQEVKWSAKPVQQQSIQTSRFDTSPVPFKQEQVQDYASQQPSPYSFSYDAQLEDGSSSRSESADASGKVVGSYSLTAADGSRRTVDYVADADGFRANVNTNEFGTHGDSPADVQLYSSAPKQAPAAPLFKANKFSQMRVAAQIPETQSQIKTAFQPQASLDHSKIKSASHVKTSFQPQASFDQSRIKSASQVKTSFQPQGSSFGQSRIKSASQTKSTFQPQASPSQVKGYQGQAAVQYASVAQQESYSPYSFAYDAQLEDGSSSRSETADGSGKVVGSYSLGVDDGRRRQVDYVADAEGFRASVTTNEQGTKSDSPADVQLYSSAVIQEEGPAAHRASATFNSASVKTASVKAPLAVRAPTVPAPAAFKASAGHYTPPFVQQQAAYEPSPYSFAYDAEGSSRSESADASGAVRGSYQVQNEDGTLRVVQYVADHQGFRANVQTNEPGTKSEHPADVLFMSNAPQTVYPKPLKTSEPVQQRPYQDDESQQKPFHTSEPVRQKPIQDFQPTHEKPLHTSEPVQQRPVQDFQPSQQRPIHTSEPVHQRPIKADFSNQAISQRAIDPWR